MRARAALAAVLALAALISAGCGNQRGEPPDLTVLGGQAPSRTFSIPGGAVAFRYPRTWTASAARSPEYAQLASGGAIAAIYGYPRSGPPALASDMRAERRRLLDSLATRDPGLLIQGARITEVDGSPAVEIRGRGRIGETTVRTRSVHVYKPHAEWVIDAYARPSQFAEAQRLAFTPLISSVRLADSVPKSKASG